LDAVLYAAARTAGQSSELMTTSSSTGLRTDPAAVYRTFLAALNAKDLQAAATVVDTTRYRENCVGFTKGFVNWQDATGSLRQVWNGLPDLHVDISDLQAGETSALAHGAVRGTNTGKLYGAPATKKSYEASFFDWVRLENGLIVERVQQADVLGQMRQLYGKAFALVGLGAMLWRL
jgi:predicted ester cyclase